MMAKLYLPKAAYGSKMASIKSCFVVRLLVIGFAHTILSVAQDVPDDVVYTDVTKTLIRNNTGVLTCRFKGAPLAVYWKKGSDPRNAPLLVRLHYGEKSGPRYDDGSCDIDENYSLVIKRVGNEDAGRYICRVSNYKGTLIHNFTDITITDAAVETRSVVALQKGLPGNLPCEPSVRPNKVSWIRNQNERLITMELSGNVPDRSGPGYDEGLYNITEEYSLVIKDVMIMHEDRYICEVTDYDTENLFWNATELSVFAFPLDPFPSIEQCPQEQQNLPSCTLRITSRTTLTCHVEGYYPHIDLFFIHGSERVDSLETRMWNNSDGTKSKRITVSSDGTSDILFECVVAGLVGQADSRSITIHLIRDAQQSHIALAAVVPVIFISAIIIIAVFVFKRRKALWNQEYERVRLEPTQKDLISYIEIWMLVKYAVQQKVSNNLASVLYLLLGDDAESGTLHTEEEYYKEICRWKKEYAGVSQRKDFFHACRRAGLKAALDQLQRYSDSPKELTSDDLEHTLWHVRERDRITELLKELGATPEKIRTPQNKSMRDVIVEDMNVLKSYWAEDVNSNGNQEVMLSIALEKINYSPNDEDFFRITDCPKRDLDKQEIQTFLPTKVTSRHCSKLVDAMMKLKEKYPVEKLVFGRKSKDVWIDEVIEKNRTDLFDSHQMIEDWWAEQNCSNYEKRCRLRSAADGLQDQANIEASGEKWPSTKKLEQIVTLVPQSQLMRLWKALKISYDSDDLMCQWKRLEKMGKWRDGFIKMNQEEKYRILVTALKSIGFDGLLSRPIGDFIYKAELVDMALDLIMEDFRPFAHALGIKGTRLTSYKRAFHPYHLDIGTISLVLTLADVIENVSIHNTKRLTVCSILNKAGYQKVTSRFMFASEPSFGELCTFGAALTLRDKHKVDVVLHKTTGEIKPTTNTNSNNVATDKEQSPSGAATQGDEPTVDVASHTGEVNPSRKSNNNVVAETEQSHSMAATHGDEYKGNGGSPASTGQSIPDEESDHNVGTDGGQSPSESGIQAERRMVHVGSHLSSRYIKKNERSDSNVGTDGDHSHSEAGTHCVESKDDVSNEPNMPTKVLKSAKESDENVEFKIDHFSSRAAAAPGDETESHCSENLKGEELHTGKGTSMAVDEHETEIGGSSHATGIIKKLRKKNKKVQNRQIPINENKPEKLQTSLQETSVGQGSQETSEEKTPKEKSQSDRKDELLNGHFQETLRSEAALTSVDGEKTETNYDRGTEGSCGKSLDDLQRILGLTDEDIPESSINPVLMMFKIWKERICPGLTDHRVVLAKGVKKIGKPYLVPAVMNGEYHSNKTSIEFIEDMLKGMDEDRRTSLESLLKKAGKKKWPTSSSGIAQDICYWVADWTKELEPSFWKQLKDFTRFTEKAKQHRDFNNDLVDHGFLNLAREIINIEEYWLTA